MPDLITYDQIAEACRNNDAISEEHLDLPGYLRERGIDPEGLTAVAQQRGLRMVMIMKGLDPNQTKAVGVRLTPDEEAMVIKFAGCFLDGFAARSELVRLES